MEIRNGFVLINEKVSETILYAVEELINFFKESTGCELKVANDEKSQNVLFALGRTPLLKKANSSKDYSVLKEDGFFIVEKDETVFIDGNTDAAVLYGVYDFLETYLGVRFFSNVTDSSFNFADGVAFAFFTYTRLMDMNLSPLRFTTIWVKI